MMMMMIKLRMLAS